MCGEEPLTCELKDAFPVGPEFVWRLWLNCPEHTRALSTAWARRGALLFASCPGFPSEEWGAV